MFVTFYIMLRITIIKQIKCDLHARVKVALSIVIPPSPARPPKQIKNHVLPKD